MSKQCAFLFWVCCLQHRDERRWLLSLSPYFVLKQSFEMFRNGIIGIVKKMELTFPERTERGLTD
jgi:hypothetical protein